MPPRTLCDEALTPHVNAVSKTRLIKAAKPCHPDYASQFIYKRGKERGGGPGERPPVLVLVLKFQAQLIQPAVDTGPVGAVPIDFSTPGAFIELLMLAVCARRNFALGLLLVQHDKLPTAGHTPWRPARQLQFTQYRGHLAVARHVPRNIQRLNPAPCNQIPFEDTAIGGQ